MTAPFEWTYTVSDNEALDQDQFNDNMAALVDYINSTQSQVDNLAEAAAPDLSNYVTVSTFQAHLESANAHLRYALLQTARTAIAGSNWDGVSKVVIEVGTVTLVAGAATYTYSTVFTNGVLGVQVSVKKATTSAVSWDTCTTSSVAIHGSGTDVIDVLVIGW